MKGIDCYVTAQNPLLRVSNCLKRLKWCRERLPWSVEDWAKVIFSEESNFEMINHKSRLIIKRLAGEKFKDRFCVPTIQGGGGPTKEQGHTTFIMAELTSTTTKKPSKVNFCQQPELFTENDNDGYFSMMAQRLTLQSCLKSGLIRKTLQSCRGQLVLQISIPSRAFGLE